MKIFSKYMFIALTACFALASCSDDDDYSVGPQDTADRAGVYFPSDNVSSLQLDPSDPTEVDVTVARLNTSGALEVPITVQVDDSAVFEVPVKAVFADGESTTTIKIDFSKTDIGSVYKLVIAVPAEYVSLYKEFDGGVSYTLQTQRIKWIDWGTGYMVEGFEGFEGTLKILKAEGMKMYRIESPYKYVLAGYGYTEDDIAEVSDPYIEFSISGETVTFNTFLVYDYDYEAGQFVYAYWPSELSPDNADYDAETMLLDEKTLQITPVYYVPGAGGWGAISSTFTLDGDITFNDK